MVLVPSPSIAQTHPLRPRIIPSPPPLAVLVHSPSIAQTHPLRPQITPSPSPLAVFVHSSSIAQTHPSSGACERTLRPRALVHISFFGSSFFGSSISAPISPSSASPSCGTLLVRIVPPLTRRTCLPSRAHARIPDHLLLHGASHFRYRHQRHVFLSPSSAPPERAPRCSFFFNSLTKRTLGFRCASMAHPISVTSTLGFRCASTAHPIFVTSTLGFRCASLAHPSSVSRRFATIWRLIL